MDIDREEKHLILESLATGAVFGLLSIIENKPRSATVETRIPSILIKLDLAYIAHSFPQGRDIYNTIVIDHISDLATIIRSTNTLAIRSMKTGMEEFRKRISVGKFLFLGNPHCGRLFLFRAPRARLCQIADDDDFCHFRPARGLAVIVVCMMHSTPYSWTDYGFTLKNWRDSLADTLLKTGIFIVVLTLIKWILTLTELAPAPVFSFPFFRRYPFLFAFGIAMT